MEEPRENEKPSDKKNKTNLTSGESTRKLCFFAGDGRMMNVKQSEHSSGQNTSNLYGNSSRNIETSKEHLKIAPPQGVGKRNEEQKSETSRSWNVTSSSWNVRSQSKYENEEKTKENQGNMYRSESKSRAQEKGNSEIKKERMDIGEKRRPETHYEHEGRRAIERREIECDKSRSTIIMKHKHDRREYDRREYDRREYDSREYDRREYDRREYDSREYDRREYDRREYDSREYDRREYDRREYDMIRNTNVSETCKEEFSRRLREGESERHTEEYKKSIRSERFVLDPSQSKIESSREKVAEVSEENKCKDLTQTKRVEEKRQADLCKSINEKNSSYVVHSKQIENFVTKETVASTTVDKSSYADRKNYIQASNISSSVGENKIHHAAVNNSTEMKRDVLQMKSDSSTVDAMEHPSGSLKSKTVMEPILGVNSSNNNVNKTYPLQTPPIVADKSVKIKRVSFSNNLSREHIYIKESNFERGGEGSSYPPKLKKDSRTMARQAYVKGKYHDLLTRQKRCRPRHRNVERQKLIFPYDKPTGKLLKYDLNADILQCRFTSMVLEDRLKRLTKIEKDLQIPMDVTVLFPVYVQDNYETLRWIYQRKTPNVVDDYDEMYTYFEYVVKNVVYNCTTDKVKGGLFKIPIKNKPEGTKLNEMKDKTNSEKTEQKKLENNEIKGKTNNEETEQKKIAKNEARGDKKENCHKEKKKERKRKKNKKKKSKKKRMDTEIEENEHVEFSKTSYSFYDTRTDFCTHTPVVTVFEENDYKLLKMALPDYFAALKHMGYMRKKKKNRGEKKNENSAPVPT